MGTSFESGRTGVAPRSGPSLSGRVLGPYRVVTELGAGGMGTVWYAEHQQIGRRVAIKVLHDELARAPEPVARFLREARAVNAIRHPNIVDITDLGDEDGLVYLVMELLEGETLGARLERDERLDVALAVEVIRQIASAVGAAHARRIVHRDLKPENVFLCGPDATPERVKVLDFGIAKLAHGPGTTERGRTRPGLVLGTPRYMSPEQCLGARTVDHRSDQYSLGVVAYEMLTGAPPFDGESFGQLVVAHSTEPPVPPDRRVAGLSAAIGRVICRALAKRPEDRFEDVETMARALADAVAGRTGAPVRSFHEQRDLERRQSVVVGRELTRILRRRFAYGRAELPGIPIVVSDCLSMLEIDEPDLSAVSSSLERDPLVASRLLRVVNSPAFGGRGRILSIHQAVCRLGIKRTRSLLLELSVRQVFVSRDPRIRLVFRRLWEHCVAVGALARGLAHHLEEGPDPDVAYMAGLLHDVGKPIVAAFLLDAERKLLEEAGASWMGDALWLRIVEQTHREAGRALAREWQLPAPVHEAIDAPDRYDFAAPDPTANLVRYADALARVEGLDAGEIDYAEAHATALEGRQIFDVPEELEAQLTLDLVEHVRAMTGDETDGRPAPAL
ncbi:MAG TPA: HDOD domain-containing protein, partial [Sandaracinaceae bacterium LLY-WYZ-13_1]|nr:HDOD domain-containing protein [Sandaracinaceae bacterium LLY-WYZ-13_1]